MSLIHPVILSGGVGSRLWPLSRAERPKQFLPLVTDEPMIVDAARRLAGPGFAPPIIVCNVEHRFLAAEALRAAGLSAQRILLEPEGRNTAAAIALGALAVAASDAKGLVLAAPADALVKDPAAFRDAIERARPAAEAGRLTTFGVRPSRPETGYGYIEAGAPLSNAPGVRAIARFVEKPDAATAAEYVASGAHFWNAGLFMMRADAALAALDKHAPAILAAAGAALAGARMDLDFTRLDPAAFAEAPEAAFDVAVMERTDLGAVAPVDMGWSDLGAFQALWEAADRDAAGNAVKGAAELVDVRGSFAWAEPGRLIGMVGVENVVAVATDDAVLVAGRERAADVKALVASLEASGRPEARAAREVYRPWGSYRTIDHGPGFLVKRITVKPRSKLSLQFHHHRAEHWVVVDGVATVSCGANVDEIETFDLEANQSTYIPKGAVHRLENRYERPLELIEVQTGHILEEEDIVRLDDAYGRREG